MADMNINEVQSSIDKVTSSMKNLVTLQMAQLTKSSAEYASHIDDAADKFKKLFDLETKHIKKLKEANRLEEEKIRIEERLAKLKKMSVASDKAREQIEKRIQDLKSKKIEKEEDLIKEIKKLRKEGLDIDKDEISSQKELIRFLENRKSILIRNVEINKKQEELLEKQVHWYNRLGVAGLALNKKLVTIRREWFSISGIVKKVSNATSGWLSQLAGLYSIGRIFEQVKDNVNYYRDSMWGLSVSLHGTNDSIIRLMGDVNEVNTAFVNASVVAARFGVDSDKVRETMSQLSSKVLFLKRELDDTGKVINRFNPAKVGNMTKVMTVFAKTMGMDVSEAVDMYSESIRRFGNTSGQAIKQMSRLQAETLTFNNMLVDFFDSSKKGFNDFENVTVFANEIGRAMLELQQGTRYWVQDLQMMNTQFNAHINLLIKQGKSQKEALAIAKNFQKVVSEPTSQLAKYNVGKELRSTYLKAIEDVGPNATEQQKREAGALAMGLATKNEKGEVVFENRKMQEVADQLYYLMEVRNKHGKGRDVMLTQANIFQEILGGLDIGRKIGFDYQSKFAGKHDLTVASTQGIGETASEALNMDILMSQLKKYGLENVREMSEAIRILREKEFDEVNGGLDSLGKASKKLIDNYLLSKEGLEWQRKHKESETLSPEEAALKFRESKIKESIDETNETLKQNTKINEKNGEVMTDAQGQESNTISNKASDVRKITESITGKAGLGLAATIGSAVVDVIGTVGSTLFLSRIMKGGLGNIQIPKGVPQSISGSVGNAVSKISPKSTGAFGIGETKPTLPKATLPKDLSGYDFGKKLNIQNKVEIPKSTIKVDNQWYNSLKNSSNTIKTSSETIAKANALTSKSSNVVSKVLPKLGRLGSKVAPALAIGSAAYSSYSSVKKFSEGDIVGALVESYKQIPVIGDLIENVANFRKDYLEKQNNKDSLFEDFNKVTTSIGILPENIDKAIEDYVNQAQGLSEESMEELKKSLKDSYAETYKEAQKADTKNPEAILLRKKLEYGQNNQAVLAEEQIKQEKATYEQLDDIGKVIANQEKMFKLHEDWFGFHVEVETRKLLNDKSFSQDERMTMLKGMMHGSAGISRIEKAVDASGVETWKVMRSKSVTAANKTGMLD